MAATIKTAHGFDVYAIGITGKERKLFITADTIDDVDSIVAAQGARNKDFDGNPFPIAWEITLIVQLW